MSLQLHIDDIVILLRSWKQHRHHIQKVLESLKGAGPISRTEIPIHTKFHASIIKCIIV